MNYQRKFFDPKQSDGLPAQVPDDGRVAFKPEGGNVDELYVFAPKVILALNVALATNRPLLVAGEPGCGKSSLARSAAAVLGWRYYPCIVTSRTQASDVQWTFDAVRRLNDASKREGNLLPDRQYIEPGPLWWAFNPESAAVRGKFHTDVVRANDPAQGARSAHNAVVLIDEIDKAEPDVPNDLLEPFDRRTFTVRETGDPITANRTVLMVLTTNRERTLPRAFVRRCVTLDLEEPTATWLANIANRRYGESREHVEIAEEVMALRAAAKTTGIREPSTAEYLDAINACRVLTANRASTDWEEVKRALLWKSDAPLPTTKRSGVASD